MDILNPRELASLIWLGLIFGLLVWKAKAWPLLLGLVRSFCKPIILRVVAMMAAWVAGSVWLLSRAGLWDLANLKTTLIWFVVFALGWMFNLKRWEGDPGDNAKATIKEVLGVTTFVTFLAEFYTLDLVGELILVPVFTFVAVIGTFAQGRKDDEPVAKVFGTLMSILGLALLSYAAWRLITDLRGFATPETGREFAVPGLLSLLFIPFMYALSVHFAYGQVSRMLEFSIKDPVAHRYARRRLFLWFWFDVRLLRRWRIALFRLDATTPRAVALSVSTMKAARRRERLKPHVPHEFGWSPYRAARFLSGQELNAGDYDPGYGGWSARSPTRTLRDGVLGDTLRYEVNGSEEAATELTLSFRRDRLRKDEEDTPDASITALKEAVLALLFAVFGKRGLEVSKDLTGPGRRAELDGIVAEFVEDDGTHLVIRHPLHRDESEPERTAG